MLKKETKNINPKVYALKKGTIYKSGKNPNATVNKTPTTYKGGKMAPPMNANPAAKDVTKSTMSKAKMGGSYKKGGMVKSMKKK